MSNGLRNLLKVIIFMSLVLAVFMGYQRHEYEIRNKNVEIAVNLSDIENLANEAGRNLPQEITLFKTAGATTFLYKEETLADIKKFITIYNGPEFLLRYEQLIDEQVKKQLLQREELSFNNTYIFVQDHDVFKRMVKHLSAKIPQAHLSSYEIAIKDKHPSWLIVTGVPSGTLGNLGVGFNRNIIAYLEKNNLQVLPQIRSWNNANIEGLNAIFSDLDGFKNINTLLFNDKALPGFPDKARLWALADMMKQRGWNIGLIEFMPQKGFDAVAYANNKNVLRFFSIDANQGEKVTPEQAIDKYTLAATERNDRLVFARQLAFSTLSQEQGYISHIDALRRALSSKGLVVGPIKDAPVFPIHKYPIEFFVLLLSLGAIAGGLLLADKMGYFKLGLAIAGAIFFIDVYLIFKTVNGMLVTLPLAQKAMALLAAIIFPSYAVITTLSKKERNIWQSFAAFFKAAAISLIGAALVIGFLADRSYMVKIDQFLGVKLAHLVPMLLVLWYFYTNQSDAKSFTKRTMDILKEPLTFGYAMISFGLLAAVFIYMARTGNEATALVSGFELKFRALLDNLLYVRPRTKEFLIAHPLLLMLYYLGYRFRYLPFAALAVIGQASLVDTFAHIHTPIYISIIRTLNGVWLGLLIGVAAIIAYLLYFKNWGSEAK